MASRRRVVVTGMGVVAPNGNDVGAFWDALVNGRSGIGPIALFDAAEHKVKIAGQVKDFDHSSILEPKEARRTDRFVQFAVYASMQAAQDAGLDPARVDPERVGVIFGSGIGGIDTRRLTRHLRDLGAMPGAFGTADEATLRAAAAGAAGTDGIDLVATVTCDEAHSIPSTGGERRIVAYDFGIKATILRHLSGLGEVTVVPASTSADEVLALGPDGVFLSNGPGDPEPLTAIRDQITDLLGRVPVFGICLGHQLLAGALGAETFKLPFGHHGGNHPVRNLATSTVEITSQNHNYCVAEGSIPSANLTHVNLNDGTVEGLRCRDFPAFSVQYHPEAGPGPHDSRYLFAEFEDLMAAFTGKVRA